MFDMSKGYIRTENRLKSNAVPPDGVNKLQYDEDDWETVEEYVAYTPEDAAYFNRLREEQTASDRLNNLEISQNDVVLALADIIGGADVAS